MRLKVDNHKVLRTTKENWREIIRKRNLINEIPKENFFIATLKAFTENSSIHAVHYLTASTLRMIEKLFWLLIIIAASLAMVYCCILLSNRFRSSLTSTVFESMTYDVTEIPFAAVTLCNFNRLNYNKSSDAVEKFIPNTASEEEKKLFVKFLEILQNMDYGSFDEFEPLESDYKGQFDHLNISSIYQFMMHQCEDFFIKCFWRGKPIDCCKLFSLQITEYGLCYSFNSFTNEATNFINRTNNFPWRVANSGRHTALDVVLNTQLSTKVERENSQDGIVVILQHPNEFPNNGQFIATKSIASLIIKPTAFSTSDDVSSLHPADRQCIYYHHEADVMNLTHFDGLPYNRPNCMSACRQQHLMKFCNCTVSFLFPSGEFLECNVTGLLCLAKFNTIFNAEKPVHKNPFFDENEEGIECFCLPECNRIEYQLEMSPIYDKILLNEDYVQLEIYYGRSTMMKYRTDVLYSWLDLVAGFGGILGLFFGCSILSGVEFIYFSTIALLFHYRRSKGKLVKSIRAKFPFVN